VEKFFLETLTVTALGYFGDGCLSRRGAGLANTGPKSRQMNEHNGVGITDAELIARHGDDKPENEG